MTPETLIERARVISRALTSGEPLAGCPYPRGPLADRYTVGAASIVLDMLADLVEAEVMA